MQATFLVIYSVLVRVCRSNSGKVRKASLKNNIKQFEMLKFFKRLAYLRALIPDND
jgi:hypothetical protein